LKPTGLAKPDITHGLRGTGTGLACQEAAGQVFGQVWDKTKPFLLSKLRPLAGYPDLLLTLLVDDCVLFVPIIQNAMNGSFANSSLPLDFAIGMTFRL